jgi:hypothetical protein
MVVVQIQLGVALSTLARLAHLDDGFGELPWWWIHAAVLPLVVDPWGHCRSGGLLPLFFPCFSSFFLLFYLLERYVSVGNLGCFLVVSVVQVGCFSS